MYRNLLYILLCTFLTGGTANAADTTEDASIVAEDTAENTTPDVPETENTESPDIMQKAKADMLDFTLRNSTNKELIREAKRMYLIEKKQAKAFDRERPEELSKEILNNREKLYEYIKAHIDLQ